MSNPRMIVITGVTKGLGRAMTSEIIRQLHTVFGCGRSERLINEMAEKFPHPNFFKVVDVTSYEDVKHWADEINMQYGIPDMIINNAAIINKNAPLWKISEEEFSTVIDVNIKGVTNVIRAFVPYLLEKQKGLIVNFSSGWGRSTSPEVAPYCATKWAIEGLTRALAQELPSGIAATALNPGVINTDMLQSCFGGQAAFYPSPEKWAKEAVPYILSLDAKDNGRSLTVPH